jgi:hypothetical protein
LENISPPFSGSKSKPIKKPEELDSKNILLNLPSTAADLLLGLLFDSDDGSNTFL